MSDGCFVILVLWRPGRCPNLTGWSRWGSSRCPNLTERNFLMRLVLMSQSDRVEWVECVSACCSCCMCRHLNPTDVRVVEMSWVQRALMVQFIPPVICCFFFFTWLWPLRDIIFYFSTILMKYTCLVLFKKTSASTLPTWRTLPHLLCSFLLAFPPPRWSQQPTTATQDAVTLACGVG
jgi:hypothetical protein